MPTHVINSVTEDVQVPIFKRTITLTDAEIKALPSSAYELLPAPGAGKTILFHGALSKLNTSAAAYNPGVSGTLRIKIGTAPVSNVSLLIGWFDQQDILCTIHTPYAVAGSGSTAGQLEEYWGFNESAIDNQPAILVALNGGAGDFTGGNAANTLQVTIFYSIVDL